MPFIDMQGEIPVGLPQYSNYQAYNILDSCVTAQLLPVMMDKLTQNTAKTYRREMELQSLCLEMSRKGLPIDQFRLAELLWELEKDCKRALDLLHKFCEAVGARAINPRSTTDVPWFFYQHLGLPAIYEFDRKTKERKITSDAKALEKLRANYPIAVPFVNAILAYREAAKMASVFTRGLEPRTGNLRCNFSPSGTETGRLSSQQNPYGRGTNAQNLTDRVRQAVTAPDGWALVHFDLKTAESLAVGFISRCVAYIDACMSGDVHTSVSRLVFPRLPWTGELTSDKALAETPFYRHFSHRDMAKRGGHGTNYYGTPRTMAMHLKVTTAIIEQFQSSYFAAFPELSQWHLDVIARVQRDGVITNALGRERRFWGRPDDAATWREAIAFDPQSLVADVMNEGLKQVYAWLLRHAPHIPKMLAKMNLTPLLDQVHDAADFLIPIGEVNDLAPLIMQHMEYPVDFGEQGVMTIPFDAQVGKRWCHMGHGKTAKPWNTDGLRAWKPGMDLSFLP